MEIQWGQKNLKWEELELKKGNFLDKIFIGSDRSPRSQDVVCSVRPCIHASTRVGYYTQEAS